jgi:hypothetical protein
LHKYYSNSELKHGAGWLAWHWLAGGDYRVITLFFSLHPPQTILAFKGKFTRAESGDNRFDLSGLIQ